MKNKACMGIIVGNRGFFPDHLAKTGREEMIKAVEAAGMEAVVLGPKDSKYGAVETREEAKKCAELFRSRKADLDGIIITLPNFGEERPIAETLRMAELDVPVLVQATPDAAKDMSIQYRRDSFCGKMSTCNNLSQCGIPYSLTTVHTERPDSEEFCKDLQWFAGVCRVVKGLRNLRVGAIGARPVAFRTVRFSEKLLEAYGISVETIDLSEIFGRIERLKEGEKAVQQKLNAIKRYVPTEGVSAAALVKMAKLAVVIEKWMKESELQVTALQCWTSMEEYFGVVPCSVMSMMSNGLLPSACEVDVCGAVAMYALQCASGTPSALLDWNNNYGEDPDKTVFFHCSNIPKSFLQKPRMDFQEIIAGSVGKQNSFGTCVGRIKPGPMTYLRLSTNDLDGEICGYVGEGVFTEDSLQTFGGYGVAEIPDLQDLLRFICENGFEHHVAVNLSSVADILDEALNKYLDWDIYLHD